MAKRHLPLVQGGKPETTEPPRPAWQWVGFGATAIVAVWLPLSALAWAVAARPLGRLEDETDLRAAALRAVVLYGFALSLGALAGGYLVGHWGPARVGIRHAALAGLAAAVLLGAATWTPSGPAVGAVLLAVISPMVAALGGWLGRRGRPPASSW